MASSRVALHPWAISVTVGTATRVQTAAWLPDRNSTGTHRPADDGATAAVAAGGPGAQRAAERWRQRARGLSIRNQLAMAMAKMMASRTASVGPYDQCVP